MASNKTEALNELSWSQRAYSKCKVFIYLTISSNNTQAPYPKPVTWSLPTTSFRIQHKPPGTNPHVIHIVGHSIAPTIAIRKHFLKWYDLWCIEIAKTHYIGSFKGDSIISLSFSCPDFFMGNGHCTCDNGNKNDDILTLSINSDLLCQ